MDGVQTSIVPWKNKVADRENIYTGVRPRTTQILAAFKASGAASISASAIPDVGMLI